MNRVACLAWVPLGLTVGRASLAPVLVWAAWHGWPGWAFVVALTAGFLSDIYDGVLARRWGIATPTLRRLDSAADVVYHVGILAAACHLYGDLLARWTVPILGLLALEGAVQLTSLVRWRTVQATHSFLAKLWGLTLWIAFVALLGLGVPGPVAVALAVGYVADLEVLFILLIAARPPVDVRSARAAWRQRRAILPVTAV